MASAVLSQSRPSLYDAVTAHIIAAIEAGTGTCVMPWHGGTVPMTIPMNAMTRVPYRGINIVTLWARADTMLYPSAYWAGFEQWRRLGASVRKGERGTPIVFFKKLENAAGTEGEDGVEAARVVIRYSHVFNAAQVDGWDHPILPCRSEVETNEQVEAFVQATKADVRLGSPIAAYRRNDDYIVMPAPSQFVGTPTSSPTEAFYAVLLHELTHWTGAPHRLDRVKGKQFGDPDYAFEELVAELGAAFLCSAFGIVNEPRKDHAAYIAHWLDALGRDNRAIFRAASLAQQAVEYLSTLTNA